MTFSLVLLSGLLVAAGLTALVVGLVPTTPALGALLGRLSADPTVSRTPVLVEPSGGRLDRLGAMVYRHSPIALTERQRRSLKLQDKSITEFYSDKAVLAVIGALLPAMVGLVLGPMMHLPVAVPAVATVVGVAVGFFVPDLILMRSSAATRSGAVEALLVYIDLVTLERLANASATQALRNAAELSEVPVFSHIRVALERAQLEQQSPYGELRRLADQLNLPELTDVADVMQMDETGAALSGTLRARVRELRDAHLMKEQAEASATAEGMTIYMALPAMIFGLIFMGPPLLSIVFG